jgi:hypothetical protein
LGEEGKLHRESFQKNFRSDTYERKGEETVPRERPLCSSDRASINLMGSSGASLLKEDCVVQKMAGSNTLHILSCWLGLKDGVMSSFSFLVL